MSWPRIKLRELITLTGGHAFKSGDFEDSGMPLIRIGTANSGVFKTTDFVFLPQEYKSKYSKYLVMPKDLLVTLTGTVGKGDYGNVCEATDVYGSYLLNQRVAKINIETSNLYKRYLYLFLATPEVKINLTSLSRGVRQANIKNDDILDLEIPLPSLDEQKRIAGILDKADAILRKRQQAIQLADDFLRSVFLDMFGDPATNPKCWEVVGLGEHIGHANNGLSRRRKIEENVGDIVLRLQDVHYDGIRFDKDLNRIELEEKEKNKFVLDKGDLLFVRVNGNPDYVGRSAVFDGHKKPVYHNDHLIRIKMKDSFNSRFLSYTLNLPGGKKIIASKTKTSAGQHTISQGGIESLKFYLPPKELQNTFVNIQKAVLSQVKKQLTSKSEIDNSFNSLSQKAFAREL